MKAKGLLLTITILNFLLIGCAEKKEVGGDSSNNPTCQVGATCDNANEAPPIQDTQTDANNLEPDDDGWGIAVPLVITDESNFKEFTGRSEDPVFEATRLYHKIEKDDDNYRATIRLYYRYESVVGGWGSGSGTVNVEHRAPKFESGITATDIRFNKFYNRFGDTYWVAFLEEKVWNPNTDTYRDFKNFDEDFGGEVPFGSIMIVLDDVRESGASGKVYFKNFTYSSCIGGVCPNKPDSTNINYKCWNITHGPYQCREFTVNNDPTKEMLRVVSGQVQHNLDVPAHYKELGTIQDVFLPQ